MIRIKKLKKEALIPVKAYDGDAGFDVFSCEDVEISKFNHYKFALGLSVEIPENYVLIVAEKSGMASKFGIMTIGNIIDSTYRGEIHVIIKNVNDNSIFIKKGQKIAQLLLMPCYTGTSITEVEELTNTRRGDNGFGSTGI